MISLVRIDLSSRNQLVKNEGNDNERYFSIHLIKLFCIFRFKRLNRWYMHKKMNKGGNILSLTLFNFEIDTLMRYIQRYYTQYGFCDKIEELIVIKCIVWRWLIILCKCFTEHMKSYRYNIRFHVISTYKIQSLEMQYN
jgi:hypothetical protein